MPDPIPLGVYYTDGNFYSVETQRGCGNTFYALWRHRVKEFPQSCQEAHDRYFDCDVEEDLLAAERELVSTAESLWLAHRSTVAQELQALASLASAGVVSIAWAQEEAAPLLTLRRKLMHDGPPKSGTEGGTVGQSGPKTA